MDDKHDVGMLAEQVEVVRGRLVRIVEDDRLAELLRIFPRPGWTTPAEYELVRGALLGLDGQVTLLERMVDAVVVGADLVSLERVPA